MDQMSYLEERYGRNLDISFAGRAKIALRRRIAGTIGDNVDINEALLKQGDDTIRSHKSLDENDVWLCPTGMSAIWTAHQLLLTALGPRKSVCFGYVTLGLYTNEISICGYIEDFGKVGSRMYFLRSCFSTRIGSTRKTP